MRCVACVVQVRACGRLAGRLRAAFLLVCLRDNAILLPCCVCVRACLRACVRACVREQHRLEQVCLWAHNAWHGGMWRSSVYVRTCVVPAAVIGLAQQYSTPLTAAVTAAVGGVAYAALRPRARL